MLKFSSCNLVDKVQSEDNHQFEQVYHTYNQFLCLIREKLKAEERFRDDVETHMKEINEYLTKTYLRLEILRRNRKSKGIDEKLNK